MPSLRNSHQKPLQKEWVKPTDSKIEWLSSEIDYLAARWILLSTQPHIVQINALKTRLKAVGYCITIKYFKLEGMTLKSVHYTRTVVLLKQKDPTSMGLFPHVHHSNILHSFEPLCASTVNGRCTSCIVDIPTITLSAGAHWMSLMALACGTVQFVFWWCVVFVDRGQLEEGWPYICTVATLWHSHIYGAGQDAIDYPSWDITIVRRLLWISCCQIFKEEMLQGWSVGKQMLKSLLNIYISFQNVAAHHLNVCITWIKVWFDLRSWIWSQQFKFCLTQAPPSPGLVEAAASGACHLTSMWASSGVGGHGDGHLRASGAFPFVGVVFCFDLSQDGYTIS